MFLLILLGVLIILINVLYFIFIKNRKMADLRKIIIFHLFYGMLLNKYIVKLLSKYLLLPQGFVDVKKLEKITYLFLNTSNYISLYIGITAVLGSLLIYAATINYPEKKHIFFESTKISYQFILMTLNYVLLFFNVNLVFLIGHLIFLIINLINTVRKLIIIEADRSRFPKLFVDTIKSITNKSMVNTYSNLYDNIKKYKILNSEIDKSTYKEIKAYKKGYIVNIKLDILEKIAEYNSEISQNNLKPIIIEKWLNDYVEKETTLAWLHKSYTKKAKKIFVISKNEPQNDILKNMMEYLGESLSDSLNTNNIVRLTNLVSIFYQLVDEFNIKIFEVKSSWRSNNKLIEIIDNSYEMAMSSSNTNLFREVYYLPVKVANKAYEIDEFSTFEYSIYFISKIYDFYFKTKDVYFELRTVESLKHIMYTISSDYEKSKNKYYLNTYLVKTLNITKKLVIKSIVNNDIKFYGEFLALMRVGFKNGLKKDENSDLIINSSYIGIFIYLLSRGAENKLDVYENYYSKLISDYLKMNLNTLLEAYKFVLENSLVRTWGWDNWFTPEMKLVESKAYFDKTYFKLKLAINILAIASHRHYDRASNFLNLSTYELESFLKQIDDEIIPQKEKWNLIFPNQISVERITDYKVFLEECKKLKNEKEKEETLISYLSEEKIEKIKNKFKSTLKESKVLKFFQNSGKYKFYENTIGEKNNSFGINKVEDKNFFIKNDSFYSEGLGEIYGETHIEILQYKFIEALDKNSEKRKIKSLNRLLNNFEGINNTIMFASNISDYDIEEQNNISEKNKDTIFIPRWKLKSEEKTLQEFFKEDLFIGIYNYKDKKIPVYRIYGRVEALYLLSYDKIKYLSHFNPKIDDESESVEFCSFYVKDFSHNTDIRDSLIKSNPPWLSKYEDIESKIKYLDTLVLFKSFQNIKVEFNNEDTSKIYKFDFSELND